MFNEGQCVICGLKCRKHLCKKHRRAFRFVKKYGFFALKPKLKISEPQRELYLNTRGIFRKPTFQEVTFDFYHYSRYDIVVPDHRLILEYDGEQHFKFIKMFHKSKGGFEAYKQKEKLKEEMAFVNDWKVVRFSYIEKVDDSEFIRKKLRLKCPTIKL